jgi:hypothetical protein
MDNKEFKLGDSVFTIGSVYYFKYNICDDWSPKLCPESILYIDSIANFLEKNKGLKINVESYTDSRGNLLYNDTLSFSFARRAGISLFDKGVELLRINFVGFGERKPRIVNLSISKLYSFLPLGQCLTEDFVESLDSNEKREIQFKQENLNKNNCN